MRRTADNNRIKRAIEHLDAAIVNINSIKWENRTDNEEATLSDVVGKIAFINTILSAHTADDLQRNNNDGL